MSDGRTEEAAKTPKKSKLPLLLGMIGAVVLGEWRLLRNLFRHDSGPGTNGEESAAVPPPADTATDAESGGAHREGEAADAGSDSGQHPDPAGKTLPYRT